MHTKINKTKNMHKRWTVKITSQLALALTLIIGTLVTTRMPVKADAPAPRNRLTILEIRLLRDLIDGHNFAVQMAQVCVQKASRPQLKSLCEQVISTQQQEIQTMRSWLFNWYGVSYAPTANKFATNVVNELASLNGRQFEIVFMKTLASHHWGAIEFAGEIIDRAYHHQFVDLAADVVTAQVSEINQLQNMLLNVYGVEYNGAAAAGSASVDPEPGLLDPGAPRR